MDIGVQSGQTATDDAELAKVLEGMNHPNDTNSGLSFEETPVAGATPAPVDNATPANYDDPTTPPQPPAEDPQPISDQPVETPPVDPEPTPESIVEPAIETPVEEPANNWDEPTTADAASPLTDIKKDAIEQLRPLIGKLDLPAEEKFDTILLLIRSTDDQSLVSAAYDAAKAIPDEAKRATALLDIIKEIDFFAQQK